MKTIWKFVLGPEVNKVPMPKGAQLLHVDVQGRDLCLWAAVDSDAPKFPRRILVAGTGWDCSTLDAEYVGSALMDGGSLVWHVFDAGDQL